MFILKREWGDCSVDLKFEYIRQIFKRDQIFTHKYGSYVTNGTVEYFRSSIVTTRATARRTEKEV